MIHSFRLRLALYSALLAGLALAAFGFGSHWLIRSVKLDAIDRTLLSHVEREAGRAPAVGPYGAEWARAESNIATSLALRDSRDLSMLVIHADGELFYRSPSWPDGLTAESFTWPRVGTPSAGMSNLPALISSAAAEESPPAWQLAQFRPPPGGRPPPGERPLPGERPPRPEENAPSTEGSRPPPRPDTPLPSLQERYRPPASPPSGAMPPGTVAPLPEQRPVELPPPPVPAAEPPASNIANEPRLAPPAPLAPPAELQAEPPPRPARPVSTVLTRTLGGESWRIALGATHRARVATAVNLRSLNEEMRGIRNAFLFALPVALFFVGLGAWLLSGRALHPLQKLTDTTRRVTAEGLDQRIAASGEDDEFAELIELYNGMLERLGRSFRQAHRFSADAAHELKTPLAILQGQLERAINNAEPGSPMQAELTGILDEVRRLTTISRKLLLLSQADAGRLAIHRESFDLSATLADMLEDTQMLAPHLQVSAEIEPNLTLSADSALLRQVLHNLISNAIKYNVDQGWIRITAKRWPRQIDVVVGNASTGIPKEDRGKLFQRFYRADPAHNSKVEGVGLGLALSREIARAHGGDLGFRIDHDNAVHFTLSLPTDPQSH